MNKCRGKCSGTGVTRSVKCLLFLQMGWLVSHHSFIFCLLVILLNIIIITCLSLLEQDIFKTISIRIEGGIRDLSSHIRRRPCMRRG